jgi:hypothetical protein
MAWQEKNPWDMSPEELAQAAGINPAPARRPAIIQGPPKSLDPGEAERLQLAREAAERDKLRDTRGTIPAGYERKADGSVGPMAGYDPNKTGKANEGEMKASAFLTRALGANASYEKQEVGPRSLIGQALADTAPGLLNSLPGSVGNSPERQVSDSAQDEFIAASLRQDSGAAIPPEELARQRRIYFPMPGDGPEAIAQKRAARLRAIAGLKESAGTALQDNQREILKAYDPDIQAAIRGEAVPQGGELTIKFSDEAAPVTGTRLTAAQQAEIEQAMRSGDQGQALALLQRYSGNPPTPTTVESIKAGIEALKRDPKTQVSFDYGAVDAAAQSVSDKERFGNYLAPALKERPDANVDAAVRGAADAGTLGFADEISALGNTVVNGKSYTDNLQRERAIDEADRRVNPLSRIGGQLAAAALPTGRWLGFGRGNGPRSALNYAGEGAALGGAYAAGSADPAPAKTLGQALQERASAVPTGAALGGGAAYGLAALGNAVRTRNSGGGGPPPGGQDAMDIAQAAADENIPISRPIIDPSRRDAMSYLESSIGGGGPVRRSLDATREGLETRAGELGSGGTTQAPGVIGERVQEAGAQYIARSRGIGGRLFDRAVQMAGNTTVQGREALQVLNREIRDLAQNENANRPLINYLQEIRDDLFDENGLIPKGVGAFRDLRTQLRGQISARNLTATDAERRVGLVLDAARADIARDLGQTAPAAVRQYARADRFWRERQSEIKQVVQRVIGPRDNPLSGEQVWQRIRTMASDKGDAERLSRVWDKLPAEDRADAAATIAGTLGRRSAEEEFSPALFVNSVRGLSASARQTIFGPEGARSVANLRRIAEAYRDTSARLNNSRSGQVVQWGNFLRNFVPGSAVGGLGGAAVGGPVGAALGASAVAGGGVALRNLTARALMSPDMSRWLANAPRQTTPQAIQRHITQGLALVARRDPAIAQDALGLQRYLQEAIASSPRRAAAADEEQQ